MSLLLLFAQVGDSAPPVVETPVVGYSPKKKRLRYYAEIGGMRMLFPSAEARDRALAAQNPREVAAEVIKKAAVRTETAKPAPVVEAVVIAPEWDDEEDIEMLLMAL